MRESTNELRRDGRLLNGFDYDLQVWVQDGKVLACGHPATLRAHGRVCCNGHRYAGQHIEAARADAGVNGRSVPVRS